MLERRGRAKHKLELGRLLLRDDDVQYKDEAPYDDPGIAQVTEWVGLSSGANPSSMTVASANGQMWVEDEDIGIEALKEEEAQNWVTRCGAFTTCRRTQKGTGSR